MTTNEPFQLLTLTGSPRELGRQYGSVAKQKIQHRTDRCIERFCATNGKHPDGVSASLERFAEDYRTYCPHVLEEMEGIAHGAGVTFEQILFLRTFWDLEAHYVGHGCTSFAVAPTRTQHGRMIAGQNKDIPAERGDEIVILRIVPDGDRPALLNYAYFGMCEGPGLNSHGLARFENSIHVAGWTRTVPTHLVKRLFMESQSIAECIDILHRLREDGVLGFSASFTFGEACGRVASIEVVPGAFRVVEPEDGLTVHANHLLHPELQPFDVVRHNLEWIDTFARTERMHDLLSAHRDGISVSTAGKALADHAGHPRGICRHASNAVTVASLICVPEEKVLYVSNGPPCTSPYTEYRL